MVDIAKFPNGVSSWGVPVIGGGGYLTTGTVFFVDNTTGSNANDGTDSTAPFATLAYAYDQCTADKNDIIFLMPGHTETITSTILLDTAGVSIIGIGNASKRPYITLTTTGSDNAFEVTAAGVLIENVTFYDGSSGGTAEIGFDVQGGGDDFTMQNVRIIQRGCLLEGVTICNSANDIAFLGCDFIGTSEGADASIVIEGTSARLKVIGCYFNYQESVGCDDGNIVFEVTGSEGPLIKDCITMGLADGDNFVTTVVGCSNDEMLMVHCYGQVADLTDVLVVSKSITVIDSYFGERGTFAGGALPAGTDDLNRWVPTATSNT